MNGRFRTRISGFHRQDVLDYIKQLSEQNARLEDENKRCTQELEDRDSTILYLNTLLHACVDEITQLQEKCSQLNDYLEGCISELSQIDGCMLNLHTDCGTQPDIICNTDNDESDGQENGAHENEHF